MAQIPSIPKGTRDYSPDIMVKRNYIFDTIKSVFKLYGYQPLETPAMENLSTLMGKYGEEGDKLLFKILNSGDFLAQVPENELLERNSIRLTNKISEKGLRYDLTVPFARFVVQHQSELTFPFKRYQIQPVWRADRPQKGRYREFYQCDVDVVGSDSLLHEVELIQMVDEVYRRLHINVRLLINNRKILAGIAETIGHPDKLTDITVAIDKMDKIGGDAVNAELREKGIDETAIEKLQPILNLQGSNNEKLERLQGILQNSPTGLKGIEELTTVFNYLEGLSIGTEVKNMSGVGISFGADRIFDVMQQLNLFPEDNKATTQILFVNFGAKEERYCLPLMQQLRAAGINTEIYPEPAKMKKQMGYADKKGIPFVALVGETEMQENKIALKNMATGEQQNITLAQAVEILKK